MECTKLFLIWTNKELEIRVMHKNDDAEWKYVQQQQKEKKKKGKDRVLHGNVKMGFDGARIIKIIKAAQIYICT